MPEPLFDGRMFSAFLFDMDGTLLLSTESAERVWSAWARERGLDVASFLPTIHGVRTIETMRNLGLDEAEAEREARSITQAEIEDSTGVHAVPGAALLLASLPAERWTIATSAPRELALARLAAAGLPMPQTLLTAEDVSRGKPNPECYKLAAAWLGAAPETCLVFEDAPAGIAAAEAAGAAVAVVTAGHTSPLKTTHPTLTGFDDVLAIVAPDGIGLRQSGEIDW